MDFKVEEEENKYNTLKELLSEKDKEIAELKKTIENLKKQKGQMRMKVIQLKDFIQ